MDNKNIEVIAMSIANPINKVEKNWKKNMISKSWGAPYNSNLYTYRPKLTKLSKDKGIGRLLILIKDNPNSKKSEILQKMGGTSQRNETFQFITKGEMATYSRKMGYEITPLGIAILQKFCLI